MTAVSDTSPLRYLIAVNQASLLAGLFDQVLIPPGVAAEFSDKGEFIRSIRNSMLS